MTPSVEIQARPFEGRHVTLRTRTPFEQVVARGDGAELRRFLERSAPVRVVVREAADAATHIDYDEPTSIVGQFPTLRESMVPPMVDETRREALTAIAA